VRTVHVEDDKEEKKTETTTMTRVDLLVADPRLRRDDDLDELDIVTQKAAREDICFTVFNYD